MGLTLDTGALLALERRRQRVRHITSTAIRDGVRITVPSVVVAEFWRGGSSYAEEILDAFDLEPLSAWLAKIAGEAIGSVKGATIVDAIVMASAAQRGDTVLTSDFDDLDALREYFPSARVIQI